jgi:hypothetical protein
MTPATLKEIWSGRTDAQASKLLEHHLGESVRVSGVVERVTLGTSIPSVSLERKSTASVLLFFDPAPGYDPKPTVLALNLGDHILVSGTIHGFGKTTVSVDHCRLIEARGRAS